MQEKIICENNWQYFYLIPLKNSFPSKSLVKFNGNQKILK